MISTGFQWHLQNKRWNVVIWISLFPSKRIYGTVKTFFVFLGFIDFIMLNISKKHARSTTSPAWGKYLLLYLFPYCRLHPGIWTLQECANEWRCGWLNNRSHLCQLYWLFKFLPILLLLFGWLLTNPSQQTCFQVPSCDLQAFIRCTSSSLSQIQQFKVNPMVNQDQKWSPHDSIWVADVQFSVYSDYTGEWNNFSIEQKISPGGVDCKMTHECLLNGGTWSQKNEENFPLYQILKNLAGCSDGWQKNTANVNCHLGCPER